ncbi:MAG TPA: hypothetical protein VK988_09690 [Acidimicrobiales bacterium]|nr:hypothetical protein [Acidimicrobiales bacterium]
MPGSDERRRRLDQQAKKLRCQREEAKVGLRQLARALNCQHSFLSGVETGKMVAPKWLRHAYAELAAGTPLHALVHGREQPATGSRKHLLQQRLVVDEEVLVALALDGSAAWFLHRLHLRAVSSNVSAVLLRNIVAEQFDEWSYRVFEGGTVALGRRISGLVDVGIRFEASLERRDEHFVTVLLEPPPGEKFCVRWATTHYGLRRLSIRLWRSPTSDPPIVIRKVDGAEPHQKLDVDLWPRLFSSNPNGLTAATFASPRPGFGYGLAWELER